MDVLLIDDATELADVISLCFEMRWPKSTILTAGTATEGVRLARTASPDVVILDIGLPDRDGFQVCREIRSFSDVPIIMLTVRSDDHDVVKGLEWGADEYITKPFSYIQLLARVHAVIRRCKRMPSITVEQPFVTSELTVHFDTREVQVRGCPARLTNTEYNLLVQLVKNAGRPVPTSVLLTNVWGQQYGDVAPEQEMQRDPNDSESVLLVPVGGHRASSKKYLLKVHIQHLRKKIEHDPSSPVMILTERGVGYKFMTPQ
ncbi:MAG: response regulator transcription factor [Dehalococcoidia bacterium]|nr:response regulator transcription factor [Dehalococcoidia bacterium]